MSSSDKLAFCIMVQNAIKHNPSWQGDVLNAVVGGMQDALEEKSVRAVEMEAALYSALGLITDKRVSRELRDWQGGYIIKTLGRLKDPKIVEIFIARLKKEHPNWYYTQALIKELESEDE